MHRRRPSSPHRAQRGVALIMALLVVALVAALVSQVMRERARMVETEITDWQQEQTRWLWLGARQWARLILREDGRVSGQVDHLAEPWAIPIQPSRLSDFLLQTQGAVRPGDPQVWLSGQIEDAQARLNVRNLVGNETDTRAARLAFQSLWRALRLPESEWVMLQNGMNSLLTGQDAKVPSNGPLSPSRLEELQWWGLSPSTLLQLRPHAVLLPDPTPLNLNTAGPLVLAAALPELSASQLAAFEQARRTQPIQSLAQAQLMLRQTKALDARRFSVNSQFFELSGRIRLEETVQSERVLLRRQGQEVREWQRTGWPVLPDTPTAP